MFSVLRLIAVITLLNEASGFLRPGEPTRNHSCHSVRDVPQSLLDLNSTIMYPDGINATFYKQYTEAYGIPILGSAKVSASALQRACYTVRFMLAGHAGLRLAMYKLGGRVAIMAHDENTTDIPEHSHLDPYMNQRARGLGGDLHNRPLTTGAEENVLCYSKDKDRYHPEDIFLHEFAHAVDNIAAISVVANWTQILNDTYWAAKDEGLWKNTYAITNTLEYFAEGVQSYFNVNAVNDTLHNHVNTRKLLKIYDPRLFRLIKSLFPCRNRYIKRCRKNRTKAANQKLKMDCNSGDNELPDFLTNPKCEEKAPANRCLDWYLRGECTNNIPYMHPNCPNACGTCKPKDEDGCKDDNDNCEYWKARNQCDINSSYMDVHCKKSCGKC